MGPDSNPPLPIGRAALILWIRGRSTKGVRVLFDFGFNLPFLVCACRSTVKNLES